MITDTRRGSDSDGSSRALHANALNRVCGYDVRRHNQLAGSWIVEQANKLKREGQFDIIN